MSESGIRALRLNFIRETVVGTTPANPDWLRFADEVDDFAFQPESNIFERMAIGSPDVQGFNLGPEDHQMTVIYPLQRWLVGAGPVPLDAAGDGLLRDASNAYRSTHSILSRQTFEAGGTDSNGFRIYSYGIAGYITRALIRGAPNSGDPVKVELTYLCRKARSYLLNQPAASGTLEILSSDAADTTQSVTIENEGAGTSETIGPLTGVTPVVGVTAFADVDAIRLSAATQGDITVRRSGGGAVIGVIEGQTTNGGIEGDLGMPLLGTGSYEAALGASFQTVLAHSFTRAAAAIATNVMPVSIEVSNNIEANAVVGTRLKALDPAARGLRFNATVFSDQASHDDILEHLKASEGDMVWTFSGGTTARTVTIQNAALTAVGQRKYTKGEATMRRDNVFTGRGIAISTGL